MEWGRPQMIIWRVRIACWIPKATNAHSGCVILIVFGLQQWLHKRASIAYLVLIYFTKKSFGDEIIEKAKILETLTSINDDIKMDLQKQGTIF